MPKPPCGVEYPCFQFALGFTNSDRLFFLQLYRWFPSIVEAMTTIRARDAGAMASRRFLALLAFKEHAMSEKRNSAVRSCYGRSGRVDRW